MKNKNMSSKTKQFSWKEIWHMQQEQDITHP